MSTAITKFSAQSLINKSDLSEPNHWSARLSVSERSSNLKPNHYRALIEGRRLDARWIEANCRKIDGHPCLVLNESFFKTIADSLAQRGFYVFPKFVRSTQLNNGGQR